MLAFEAAGEGYDAIVAAGGDGTINEVVNGLVQAAGEGVTCPLAVLPIGTGNDFNDMDLYIVVAWDHVSWPGNDFYIGARATDDGVKAAATDVMFKMTGIEGSYDSRVYFGSARS